jgi:uncharacterized protein YukE
MESITEMYSNMTALSSALDKVKENLEQWKDKYER